MASVNFAKIKSHQKAASVILHCDKQQRLEHNHQNKDIDKTLTHLNLQYNFDYYATYYDRIKGRIDTLDATTNHNTRKDRIILLGLDIPVPEEMMGNNDKITAWYKDVNKILIATYGIQNLANSYLHFDEKHQYTDYADGQKKNSREHIQAYVIPEVDGQLCAKKLTSKTAMIKLNNAIHKMTAEKYKCKFMTGEKKKDRYSVEELKNKSLKKENEELQKQVDDLKNEKNTLNVDVVELKKTKRKLESEIRQVKEDVNQDFFTWMQRNKNVSSQTITTLQKMHKEYLEFIEERKAKMEKLMNDKSDIKHQIKDLNKTTVESSIQKPEL